MTTTQPLPLSPQHRQLFALLHAASTAPLSGDYPRRVRVQVRDLVRQLQVQHSTIRQWLSELGQDGYLEHDPRDPPLYTLLKDLPPVEEPARPCRAPRAQVLALLLIAGAPGLALAATAPNEGGNLEQAPYFHREPVGPDGPKPPGPIPRPPERHWQDAWPAFAADGASDRPGPVPTPSDGDETMGPNARIGSTGEKPPPAPPPPAMPPPKDPGPAPKSPGAPGGVLPTLWWADREILRTDWPAIAASWLSFLLVILHARRRRTP